MMAGKKGRVLGEFSPVSRVGRSCRFVVLEEIFNAMLIFLF